MRSLIIFLLALFNLSHVVRAVSNVDAGFELFGVLTAAKCAIDLAYGPSNITTDGQIVNGQPNPLNGGAYIATHTAGQNILHRSWLQIVTSDGSTELFRIYWTFATPRILSDHFVAAVQDGESVGYRVVRSDGSNFFYNGVWRFSDAAGNMAAKFASPVTVGNYFSKDNGMWGAGNGILDGNSTNPLGSSVQFWGVGNFGGTDWDDCNRVYQQSIATYIPGTKTYMYYSTTDVLPSDAPLASPTSAPVIAPTKAPVANPTGTPVASPTNAPVASPTLKPTLHPTSAPVAEPTDQPVGTNAPIAEPTSKPVAHPTGAPVAEPTNKPVATPTNAPVAEPTNKPVAHPTGAPIAAPTNKPVASPTNAPIAAPTNKPVAHPTGAPIAAPTNKPVASPTNAPIAAPTNKPVAHPTGAPIALPTNKPVASPTNAPVAAPTFKPSVKPTAVPTAVAKVPSPKPSRNPSRAPSPKPSRAPSVKPTRTPTRSPTGKVPSRSPTRLPSRRPTRLPSRAPTNRNPTKAPTRLPTAKALTPTMRPSRVPSRMPTKSHSAIQIRCIQIIIGITIWYYEHHNHGCDAVLKSAIVASVPGISEEDIIDLQVSEASRRRMLLAGSNNLRAGAKQTTDDEGITLEYTIRVPAQAGLTYEDLSAQLVESVESNRFTERIQQYAAEQDVPELQSASTSSVETTDATGADADSSSSGGSSALSSGAVAGVAVGVCAVLVLLAFVGRYMHNRRSASEQQSHLDTSVSKSPMAFGGDAVASGNYVVSDDAHVTAAVATPVGHGVIHHPEAVVAEPMK